jgi:hypothetical protein
MTILYVNGDSHSAGAEAVNSYCFAEDDPFYRALGRIPHPDNERVSYGCNIANELFAVLHCDAESASSNSRIIRTTRKYLETTTPDLIIIGWATWEREEWHHDGVHYQVTAGGTDLVPVQLQKRYKEWVVKTTDNYAKNELFQHESIWNFHLELQNQNIPHFFFNTFSYYGHIVLNNLQQYNWGNSYLHPYDENYTYFHWLKNNSFKTVNPKSYHYGPDAHRKWAEFLLPYLTQLL